MPVCRFSEILAAMTRLRWWAIVDKSKCKIGFQKNSNDDDSEKLQWSVTICVHITIMLLGMCLMRYGDLMLCVAITRWFCKYSMQRDTNHWHKSSCNFKAIDPSFACLRVLWLEWNAACVCVCVANCCIHDDEIACSTACDIALENYHMTFLMTI